MFGNALVSRLYKKYKNFQIAVLTFGEMDDSLREETCA